MTVQPGKARQTQRCLAEMVVAQFGCSHSGRIHIHRQLQVFGEVLVVACALANTGST